MNTFDQAFEALIGHEGGLADHPSDPGGLTKWGISQRAYPAVDIRSLTLDGAKAIYERDYWRAGHCHEMPPQLALLHFDACVNNGVGQAAKFLQQALGVAADGVIGPRTMAALNKATGPAGQVEIDTLCAEVLARRIWFQASLETWRTFGLGWARRLASLPYQSMGLV